MNLLHWTFALLVVALAAGCDDDNADVTEPDAPPAVDSPDVDSPDIEADIEQAGEEAEEAGRQTGQTLSEAAEETGDTLNQSRKEFAADLEQRLETLDEKIAEMKTRAGDLSAEGKADLKESWNRLEARREVVSRQLEVVRESTSDNWKEVREKTSAAWNEFEEAVRKTADRLTD